MALPRRPTLGWVSKPPPGTVVRAGHPLAQGLAGLWLFSEGGGLSVCDASADGYTGTWHGTLSSQWDSGRTEGSAGNFSGSNYVTVPNAPPLSPTTLSISAWVYASTYNQNGAILEKSVINTAYSLHFQTGNFLILRGAGSANQCVYSTAVPGGVWHHVVGNITGTTGTLYLDRKLVATATVAAPGSTSGNLNIGTFDAGSFNFTGKIDHVGLWSRALSLAEIEQLYVEPFALLTPPRRLFVFSGGPLNLTVSPAVATTLLAGTLSAAQDLIVSPAAATTTFAGSVAVRQDLLPTPATATTAFAGNASVRQDLALSPAARTTTFAGNALPYQDVALSSAAATSSLSATPAIALDVTLGPAATTALLSGTAAVGQDLTLAPALALTAFGGLATLRLDLTPGPASAVTLLAGAALAGQDLLTSPAVATTTFAGTPITLTFLTLTLSPAQATTSFAGQVSAPLLFAPGQQFLVSPRAFVFAATARAFTFAASLRVFAFAARLEGDSGMSAVPLTPGLAVLRIGEVLPLSLTFRDTLAATPGDYLVASPAPVVTVTQSVDGGHSWAPASALLQGTAVATAPGGSVVDSVDMLLDGSTAVYASLILVDVLVSTHQNYRWRDKILLRVDM